MARAVPSKSPRRKAVEWKDETGAKRSGPIPGEEYARRGLIARQQILPGMEDMGAKRLSRWEDMHPEKRAAVETRLKDDYGVTMRNAIHNHGALIDQSIESTGGRGRHFYRGGSEDPYDTVGKDAVHSTARKHGLPTHVVAAMRAALSPRSNVHDEVTNLDTIVHHVRSGGSYDDPPKITGLAGSRNAKKAMLILEQHHKGVHPHDVTDEKGKTIWGSGTQKIQSYMQGYTHPDDPGTRTTVDTHAVGGMAPHLPKTAPLTPTGKLDNKGKPFLTPVNKSDEKWVPNQEDALGNVGHYEFFDYAQRQAAEKRGLSPTEGQSLAWHTERGTKAQQPGTGKGKTRSSSVRSRQFDNITEDTDQQKLF